MLKWLRRLLGGDTINGPSSPLGFDQMKPRIERLLELDLSTDDARKVYGGEVLSTLRDFDADIEKTRELANGYPNGVISGDVWMTGAAYGSLAEALTAHFAENDWLEHEANASELWAKATLAVNAHYHHLVGPAMNANADCQRRLGNIERAKELWSGVVKDLVFLLDDFEDNPEGPYDEDRIALESLRDAAAGILSVGESMLDDIDLEHVHRNVESVLARPTPNS